MSRRYDDATHWLRHRCGHCFDRNSELAWHISFNTIIYGRFFGFSNAILNRMDSHICMRMKWHNRCVRCYRLSTAAEVSISNVIWMFNDFIWFKQVSRLGHMYGRTTTRQRATLHYCLFNQSISMAIHVWSMRAQCLRFLHHLHASIAFCYSRPCFLFVDQKVKVSLNIFFYSYSLLTHSVSRSQLNHSFDHFVSVNAWDAYAVVGARTQSTSKLYIQVKRAVPQSMPLGVRTSYT